MILNDPEKQPQHTLIASWQVLALGCIGQWLVKPALGVTLASTLVPALDLPAQVATGLILVSSRADTPCLSELRLATFCSAMIWATASC